MVESAAVHLVDGGGTVRCVGSSVHGAFVVVRAGRIVGAVAGLDDCLIIAEAGVSFCGTAAKGARGRLAAQIQDCFPTSASVVRMRAMRS